MDEATDKTKFVVGLGNPGHKYAADRHNVGFAVLAALERRWKFGRGREAFSGVLCDARVSRPGESERRVMLLAPQTYMNCSGRAVRAMADFYKAAPRDILIVLDDMALPPGRLRARAEGSAGGHNGLADVLAAMGTTAVPRLRIGIGAPPGAADRKDFVLSPFAGDEVETMKAAVELAAAAVEDWVFGGIECVMAKYNRKPDEKKDDQPQAP
ncbi:MAG: aminoacyl-tRNA hydrolase [Phycisphaerae bacterium]